MNVFVDYHHSGLLYSLHLTLEKRFGWNIYRPIGMEWFDRHFWDIAKPYGNNPETVRQFLSLDPSQKPVDGTPPLNNMVYGDSSLPHYTVRDEYHDYQQKALTFSQFLNADIDIIIGSIPDHWMTYKSLRDTCKPHAKVVAHMGNMFNELPRAVSDGVIDNLMASTIAFPINKSVNTAFYYQEQPVIPFKPPTDTRKISSYAHVIPKIELFNQYKAALPDFTLQAFGSACPDGWQHSLVKLYASMQEDMFVYHVKPGGDGYGWNWHSAFMLGRPVITNFSDYKDKLGGRLHTDGVTGIDLEKRSLQDNVALIKQYANDGTFIAMGQAAHERFTQVVNYDNEADRLKTFFENLH